MKYILENEFECYFGVTKRVRKCYVVMMTVMNKNMYIRSLIHIATNYDFIVITEW